MARKKHSAEQIVAILRQIEVELANHKSIGQACKEAGINQQNLLSLAQRVRRAEAGTGAPAERAGEREWPSAAPGDRVVAGEAGAEGCGLGKLLSPERRRCAVQHACEHHRLSERRACRLL